MKTKNELKLGYAVKNSKTSAYLYGNKNIVRMSDNDEQHITVFVFRHVPRHDNGPDHIYYTDPRQGGYDVPSELLRMVENSAAAAALGSISTPKKAASSRENGKRGGRPTEKKTYWILSGEGEIGTWEKHVATLTGIKRIATKERCGGDRWAQIWEEVPETETTEAHIYDINDGDMRDVPDEE